MLKKLILIAIFIPSIASAGFELSPSWGAFKSDSFNSTSQIELRVGYTFDFGLFLGGFYSLASDKFLEHTNHYYMGPMVGYQCGFGGYALAGYVLQGEQDLSSGGVKHSSVNGFQFTLGQRLMLAQDVYLGPEITYRTVKFDDREVQGLAGPGDREDTHVIPGINLQFRF